MFVLIDTHKLSSEQRLYLPLLLEALFESPVQRGDRLIPYEEVITELNVDTVTADHSIGLSGHRFHCGSYSQTAIIMLCVESAKYERGIMWLRELLHQTVFTAERLRIIATKIINDVAQAKRSGRDVASYIIKNLFYREGN